MVSNFRGNVNLETNRCRFVYAGALYYGSKVVPDSTPSWANPSPTPVISMLAQGSQVLESTPPPHVMRGKASTLLARPRTQPTIILGSIVCMRPGAAAHACNPSTLGGQGRQITCFSIEIQLILFVFNHVFTES